MAILVKFQDFAEQLGEGVHDLSADTIKVFLTNTEPTAHPVRDRCSGHGTCCNF